MVTDSFAFQIKETHSLYGARVLLNGREKGLCVMCERSSPGVMRVSDTGWMNPSANGFCQFCRGT